MRIISGEHKGFRFPQKNMPHARPTTDRAKEALFNILDQRYYYDQIAVLDLYSGLGGIALEFCSRGVEQVTAVEWNRKSIKYIADIIEKLNLSVQLVSQKVLPFLKKSPSTYDIVFADPPYHAKAEIQTLIETMESGGFLREGGVFILEHESMAGIQHPQIVETRVYGQSTFSFFKFEK